MRLTPRIHRIDLVACGILAVAIASLAAGPAPITVHRATTHAMRYHVALPRGWKSDRAWPVLVAIPDASRAFEANLAVFDRARGDRPYILVAPEVLSCGGAGSRLPSLYAYTAAEWDSLQGGDDFAFEDAGLAAVVADVHRQWRGESKAFLTGWEAGGHTVWAQVFRHPERWRGVVPVTPNYQRRGVTKSTISLARERATLPIQPLICGAPSCEEARSVLLPQTEAALRDARDHGFTPRAPRVVPGVEHGPMAEQVLAWCDSLRRR
jgi:GNAT superfamily N-acetyltransferase